MQTFGQEIARSDCTAVSSEQCDKPEAHDNTSHTPQGSPLSSLVTNTVSEILARLGISLLASTYQAGNVVILRCESPQVLNTHFRRFPRPMGLAADPATGRLALGTDREIVEFRNMAAVSSRLEPPEQHDACYLPRRSHITGNIDIHEMAWGKNERSEDDDQGSRGKNPISDGGGHPLNGSNLWFVNTRFSCLCTLGDEHSFVPRWWPPFISSLGLEDRCHLNGLAMVEGWPRFVTALGDTDTPAGWRNNKARGGVLIDVESGETIAGGLSMPHSPRWRDGRLWLLESGDGSLGTVELASGRYDPIVKLDGFTRGLAFCGPFAFIGLSQVRESATFSGIALVDRIDQRKCGVAIVDLRSGQQVGFVHFQDAVQEIFAVELLPHRFPDLLEPADELVGNSYALPPAALTHAGAAPLPEA
ncbi:MAG: TIGR03032 family protein [Pirellulaceae bacterium]|nr:TIGR03032 family protein [Pirellulaceae bacterium]